MSKDIEDYSDFEDAFTPFLEEKFQFNYQMALDEIKKNQEFQLVLYEIILMTIIGGFFINFLSSIIYAIIFENLISAISVIGVFLSTIVIISLLIITYRILNVYKIHNPVYRIMFKIEDLENMGFKNNLILKHLREKYIPVMDIDKIMNYIHNDFSDILISDENLYIEKDIESNDSMRILKFKRLNNKVKFNMDIWIAPLTDLSNKKRIKSFIFHIDFIYFYPHEPDAQEQFILFNEQYTVSIIYNTIFSIQDYLDHIVSI